MKRFLIFGFDQYYPSGGFRDFVTSFESVDEVKKYLLKKEHSWDYYQVFDLDTRAVVPIVFKEVTNFGMINTLETN